MKKLLLSAPAALLAITTLVACGGGGGGGSSNLSGVAAVGAPIVGGTVTANCSDGETYTTQNSTNSSGVWRISNVPSSAPPCALRLSGGSVGSGGPDAPDLYSYAESTSGDVNITPLTDLIVALAAGDPAAWFASFDADAEALGVDEATDTLFEALADAGYDMSKIPDFDPLTASFKAAAGDPYDDLLEALRDAVDGDYTALRAEAAGGKLNLPEPGTGDGAALGGKDGATGTFDGVTYTFVKDEAAPVLNAGWQSMNVQQTHYRFEAQKSEDGDWNPLIYWKIEGVPSGIGTYDCGSNEDGVLPAVRLGLGGVPKDSTSCTITITEFDAPLGSAWATVTGTFTAVIDGKTVSDGYFKGTASPPPSK